MIGSNGFKAEKAPTLTPTQTNAMNEELDENQQNIDSLIAQWSAMNFETSSIPSLVQKLKSTEPEDQLYGLVGVRNILSEENRPTDETVDTEVVPRLILLMSSSYPMKIRCLAGLCLTILCGGTTEQKDYAVNNGVLDGSLINNDVFVEKMINVVKSSHEDDDYYLVRGIAVEILTNSTRNCTPAQAIRLLMSGVYSCFMDLLGSEDEKVLVLALEGINNCLKWGREYNLNDENGESKFLMELEINQGGEKVEQLQCHPSNEVYEAAVKILQDNFEMDFF